MNIQDSEALSAIPPVGGDITHVKIESEHHCFRALSGQLMNSVTTARVHMTDGAEIQAIQVTLRHPEICVFDVSNPSPVFLNWSAQDISELCGALRDEAALYCAENQEFTLITGNGLDAEICLSGPSKDSLEHAKLQILQSMSASVPDASKLMCPVIKKSRPIRLIGSESSAFLRRFSLDYSHMLVSNSWGHCRLLSLSEIYDLDPLWREIGEAFDGFCFVLGGGMPMYLSIIEMVGPQPVMFLEYHRQNDANDLVRAPKTNFEKTYHWGEVDIRSVAIVDKVYSGGSLSMAAERYSELHPGVKTTKIGLFPKSLEGVLSCDKVVFAGQLVDVGPLRARLRPADWHLTLWEHVTS